MPVRSDVLYEDESFEYRGFTSTQKPKGQQEGLQDGLVGIIDTLYSEHAYLLSLLDSLEQAAHKLKSGKIPDYHLLLDIIDYLTQYPDEYHHPREDMLFTALQKKDKAFTPKLDRLIREHKTLAHYNSLLFAQLRRIVDGGKADRPELKENIERYISGYRAHIQYESDHIFPLAKGSLSKAELAKLNERTRFITDPLFGAEVKQQYRRLGRQLQSRMGDARDELVAREFMAAEAGIRSVSNAISTMDQLWQTANALTRQAWNEQRATVKAHTSGNNTSRLSKLPLALLQNHSRQLRRGFTEVRKVLQSDTKIDE